MRDKDNIETRKLLGEKIEKESNDGNDGSKRKRDRYKIWGNEQTDKLSCRKEKILER